MSERNAKIVELYQLGWMLKNIGPEVGLAPHTVGGILKRLGFERPAKPQRLPRGRPDFTEEIKALWAQGLCVSQIAERLNTTKGVVTGTLDKFHLRSIKQMRTRWDGAGAGGGSGRSGFAANMARRT